MDVLCAAAHPDDEIIGVGGTLARHAENPEDNVRVCILSEAEPARYDEITSHVRELMEQRREWSREACHHLGVDTVSFHDFPDNSFDAIPLLDIVKTVEDEIEAFDPEVIYTHHYGDLNISHQLTCRAVLTAARPLPERNIRKIMAYETISNSEWAVPTNENRFQPTAFVDISDQLERKLEALSMHRSEMRDHPHPRNTDNVRRNALLWGAKSGLDAAEPFEVLREIHDNQKEYIP
jgi:LmbE family N-acetylglucosaminyl deacetylase